ncbi:MAG: MFS transporter [Burkholderiales bacterium]|nr:MFS transporter [Burkholderiales bacterium]MDE2452151.1 MFS transporter [Burkholderiales bacterium]
MASRSEIAAVYAAGLVQGLALVTFPAAGAVFTSASEYGLSATEYGGMFVPQAIAAIVFALLGAGLTRRVGARRIFLTGLGANAVAMGLLLASSFVMNTHALAYGVLLLATGCLGVGFGLTVPTLNTYAAGFFPRQVDKAVLAMNALLGCGTALAPVLVAVFVGLGIWWGLPVMVGALVVVLLAFALRLDLRLAPPSAAAGVRAGSPRRPSRFGWFAAFALLYGLCETIDGNWATLLMTRQLGSSAAQASLALTAFWGSVTAGRILFAFTERWLPERLLCRWLPLLLAASFALGASLQRGQASAGILVFALAGLACSALLPLVISFAQAEFESIAASVAGGLIACYQVGYGLAAFGVGPLQVHLGWSLGEVCAATTGVALMLALLAAFVSRQSKSLIEAPIVNPRNNGELP